MKNKEYLDVDSILDIEVADYECEPATVLDLIKRLDKQDLFTLKTYIEKLIKG